MRIHLYVACRNDEDRLVSLLRHYEPLVDRIFVYDDGSEDGSLDILRAAPKVSAFRVESGPDGSAAESLQWLHNHCWKRSRGESDWVIVVDVDEHLEHDAGLRPYLAACRRAGITVVPALGYEVVAEAPPAGPARSAGGDFRRLRPDPSLGRVSVFDPGRIDEIGYSIDRRSVTPVGDVRIPTGTTLRMLCHRRAQPQPAQPQPAQTQPEIVAPARRSLLGALCRGLRRLPAPPSLAWPAGTPIRH